MAKFFVYVNNKFMVSLESTSNLAAEHEILDNIPGTQSALSFDNESIKTDCFIGCMLHAETISLDDLKERFSIHAMNADATENAKNALQTIKHRISAMRDELAALEAERDTLAAELVTCSANQLNYEKQLNITRPY